MLLLISVKSEASKDMHACVGHRSQDCLLFTCGNVDRKLDSILALMMFGSHLVLFQQWGTQC